MKKYCLACDLKEDEMGIRAYDHFHQNVWPEVKDSLKESGILDMEIYRTGNRLFMIILVTHEFNFVRKAIMDLANPVVQEWEEIMSGFQQILPWAPNGEKWLLMDRIFKFSDPAE